MIDQERLASNAQTIVGAPRGILAADQTPSAMEADLVQRGDGAGDYAARLAFRRATLRADMGKYIGGVILHDEMVRSGVPWAEILEKQNILAGGTVDQDFETLETGEPLTKGMDGLDARCEEYAQLGMRFAKFRSILRPSASQMALEKNLQLSARYAAAAQRAGLVPVCEPDVQFAGDHDEQTFRATSVKAWDLLFKYLRDENVYLPGVILKPSWIVPGLSAPSAPSARALAELTVSELMAHVPAEIAGIAFLSGGIPFDRSLELLREISVVGREKRAPWRLTFSFGRALLDAPADVFVAAKAGGDEKVLESMAEQARRASEASVAQARDV